MSEIVERVAKVIFENGEKWLIPGGDVWETRPEDIQKKAIRRQARAAIESLRILPTAMKDPYWPLSHIPGVTLTNPIPDMQSAIDAFVSEALK